MKCSRRTPTNRSVKGCGRLARGPIAAQSRSLEHSEKDAGHLDRPVPMLRNGPVVVATVGKHSKDVLRSPMATVTGACSGTGFGQVQLARKALLEVFAPTERDAYERRCVQTLGLGLVLGRVEGDGTCRLLMGRTIQVARRPAARSGL